MMDRDKIIRSQSKLPNDFAIRPDFNDTVIELIGN